ncbi:phage holin family protein [Parachitinimonas caeni]|uniref:Phage holin family protein n=1 Tax=Parachitinimonas caeni TaxID=3031301 RepID=A0ABT7DRK5_9NEIS|nr:phage holin family protein [Parachitinimonas caeni]MDK2122609.1 phage holin family protein [Parachitinimonas caeni]
MEKYFDWPLIAKQALSVGWVVALSMVGGAVNHFRHLREQRRQFRFGPLAIELLTSGFVGLLTYWFCMAASVNAPFTAVLVGISGHMGTRALLRLERVYSRFFQ